VVHEGSGRSIAVRINDRIPRKTAVLIDLSRASARALGVDGVARVSLYQP
jgi:rare lipoprotein A